MNDIKDEFILYECFLDRVDRNILNRVIINILNKEDVPDEITNKFILWFHKKCVMDSKYSDSLDCELITKMYNRLNTSSIIKLISSIDHNKNPSIIECVICQSKVENPHAYQCGHIYCHECIKKHKRTCRVRNIEYCCPKCRKQITTEPIKIFI